jgi:L,D-peptidoglycan transpeptidase YkuD (ErfK/YbiS/YcfS/YnhG family)
MAEANFGSRNVTGNRLEARAVAPSNYWQEEGADRSC